MKKVIGVYNQANYVYVQRQLYKLREEGISVESTDVLTLKKNIPTPCFIVIKNGGVVNKLIGKYSDTEFYKWLRKYI
jgi:hypothetical protein